VAAGPLLKVVDEKSLFGPAMDSVVFALENPDFSYNQP
jgi:hypothetical protein